MPYSYIEHLSDIGIRGESSTIEGAFEEGALAMLDLVFDLSTINEAVEVEIIASASDVELLFVEVLNELLSIQGRDGLALKRLETITIDNTEEGFGFKGKAFGEVFDQTRHGVKTEVKAATYSGLKYEQKGETHTLQCILDV